MKYFILILSCSHSQVLSAAVQKTPTKPEEKSIKTYLDPISLSTNEISLGPSLTYQQNKTSHNRVYSGSPPASPYYSPQTSLARQDYFDAVDSYGVPLSDPIGYHDNTDSYGVPVSDPLVYDTAPGAPLESIYDYPEYVQYYEPDLVVPDYSVVTDAPVYSPVTEFPAYEYEYPLEVEEPEPEINRVALMLLACLCILFLWPTVVFLDPADINNPDRRVETEETTTMMTTPMMTTSMMTTLMTTMIPREFYDDQQDNSQQCATVFCHVRQYVTTLGKTFLNLEDR